MYLGDWQDLCRVQMLLTAIIAAVRYQWRSSFPRSFRGRSIWVFVIWPLFGPFLLVGWCVIVFGTCCGR
ncbi:hypothetical protein BYT27DRAFT_6532385 [Phlegmacium glaucopus]|nr:hypothetical protein BYT27DRAFT_6532385 [Phlegmacium glaucopus]